MNSQERVGILIGKVLGLLPPEYEAFEPRANSKARRAFEVAQGRFLLPEEVVHHKDRDRSNDDPSNHTICRNQKEHMLLHRETDALKACGHTDWRACKFCGEHDDPDNLYINKGNVYHAACHREDLRKRRAKSQ